MTTQALIVDSNSSLLSRIKTYRKRIKHIQEYLTLHPDEWGQFQSEFNQEVNSIFRDLMIFEKKCLDSNQENKVYKLKQFFIDQFRMEFAVGDYIEWSLKKPYGYAGDYKIIDDIYLNVPMTVGLERLYDNYFQMSAICMAVRNRKDDFKRILTHYAMEKKDKPIKILDLASGPCRDIHELLSTNSSNFFRDAAIYCLDSDDHAIQYAKDLLANDSRVRFKKMNILRFALNKNIAHTFDDNFDVIYSTGLFDYFDETIAGRLIKNLSMLLKPGGILAISDVRTKFSNPSIYFMEWVADWNLVYRDNNLFRQFFLDAGFDRENLNYSFEQQGILQYVIARKY